MRTAAVVCCLAARARASYTEWTQVSTVQQERMSECPAVGDQSWYTLDLCSCQRQCVLRGDCNTVNYRNRQCQFRFCSVCFEQSCQLRLAFGWEVYTMLRQPEDWTAPFGSQPAKEAVWPTPVTYDKHE